jgi:hypothetical protein
VIAAVLGALLLGQGLQRRAAASAPTEAVRQGSDTLPDGADGEYRWRESGEVIELYVEDGRLSGYLTRRSERGQAGSAPLTFALAEGQVRGVEVHFTTRTLHGESYEFKGRLEQNLRPEPGEGPWRLAGQLTERPSGTAGEISAPESKQRGSAE